MRDEIVAGLKNALARGQKLEQAAQSFINAGYNPQEVKAAYHVLSSGVSSTVVNAGTLPKQGIEIQQNTQRAIGNYGNPPQRAPNQNNQAQQQTQQQTIPEAPSGNPPERKSIALLIIMIIAAALIFLGAVGYLVYVLYFKG